jgi:uncharacterized membrane protein
MKKNIIIFKVMGTIYILIEFWYSIFKSLLEFGFTLQGLKLEGQSNFYMFFIAGTAGLFVGILNELFNIKVIYQSILGTVYILLLEYFSGIILNQHYGYDFWDYNNIPFNLHGQICLPFAIIWFLMIPIAITLDDFLRSMYHKKFLESLKENYVKLFTFK